MASRPSKPGAEPGSPTSKAKRRRRMHPAVRAVLDALNRRELPKGINAVVLRSGLVRFRASEPSGIRGKRTWSPLYTTLDDAIAHQSIYNEERAQVDVQRDSATLQQLVDLAARNMLNKGLRPDTIGWFRETSAVWLKFFGPDRSPSTVTPTDVEAFVDARRSKVSPSRLAHFRRSFQALRKHTAKDKIPGSGTDLLRGVGDIWPAVEEVEMTFFPLRRVREMVEQIRSSGHTLAEQDADLVALLAATGWRRGELVRLKVGDVDLEQRLAWLVGKRRHEHVPLGTGAVDVLESMIARTDGQPDSPIVPGGEEAIRRAMARASRATKEPKLTAHALRHSFVSALCAAGHSVDVVKGLSRHSGLASLRRYIHIGPQSAAALDSINPTAKPKPKRAAKARKPKPAPRKLRLA